MAPNAHGRRSYLCRLLSLQTGEYVAMDSIDSALSVHGGKFDKSGTDKPIEKWAVFFPTSGLIVR